MAQAVFITGGAQGIGKCIAQRFLSQGATVFVADCDAAAVAATAAEYATLGAIHGLVCDVGDEAQMRDAMTGAIALAGGLDVFVANAGIGINRPVTELTLAEWNRVLAVNLTSYFLGAKYAAPALRERRGSIVALASTRAFQSEPNTEVYAASKGGVVALTHALAISLGPEIRVNAIAPGWIEVGDWQAGDRRRTPQHTGTDRAQHPAGRVGRPEDIAELVAYLASPAATFITGTCLTVDGGMTHKMIYV